jgi:hypothetical protein
VDTNRKTAMIVGVLFIIGTVAGILSAVAAGPLSGVLADPTAGNAVDLATVAASASQITLAALLVLVMGFALALVPVVIFPVLKQHNEPLAFGYLVFRGALETTCYILSALSWLFVVALSQQYTIAAAADTPSVRALGSLLLQANDLITPILEIVFSLGALLFYVLLWQAKLIPRLLSGWGLLAAFLYLGVGLASMFGAVSEALLMVMLVQEMVMAVWLIVKGFNSNALVFAPARPLSLSSS